LDRRLSKETIAELVAAYRAGTSSPELAQQYELSETGLIKVLRQACRRRVNTGSGSHSVIPIGVLLLEGRGRIGWSTIGAGSEGRTCDERRSSRLSDPDHSVSPNVGQSQLRDRRHAGAIAVLLPEQQHPTSGSRSISASSKPSGPGPDIGDQSVVTRRQLGLLITSEICSTMSSMLNWSVLIPTLSARDGLNVRTCPALRLCQIGSSDCSPATVRVTSPSSS